VSALRKVKDNMLSAFEALIARRTQRAEELKARMDKHQQNQEGMLAYSMINLMSEKA
ncbi:flagellar protein FliT, partial [Citrobacter freundii]|nr:flagellar protein FliT [Citrobacter freundii]